MATWRGKQNEWKDPVKRAKAQAAAKAAKEGDAKEGEKEKADEKMDLEDLDIFGIEDVLNTGNGEPLMSKFEYEDWTLMSLRFELHLLLHAFRRDVDDADRKGVPQDHLAFYYNLYYRKMFSQKSFGVEKVAEVVEFVKDTVSLNDKTGIMTTQLSDDIENFDIFVKLTEENRRERERRIDAGDETAQLKFSKHMPQQQQQQGQMAKKPYQQVQQAQMAKKPFQQVQQGRTLVKPQQQPWQPAQQVQQAQWMKPATFRPGAPGAAFQYAPQQAPQKQTWKPHPSYKR